MNGDCQCPRCVGNREGEAKAAEQLQAVREENAARLDWVLGELGNDFLLEEFKLWNPTKEQIMAAIDARMKEQGGG